MRKGYLWILMILLLLLSTGTAAAGDNGSTGVVSSNGDGAELSEDGNYYVFSRMVDITGTLSEDDKHELAHTLNDFLQSTHVDLQVYLIDSVEKFGVSDVYGFADAYYDDAKYPSGYGADRLCLMVIHETTKGKTNVIGFGDLPVSDWAIMKSKLYLEYYLLCDDAYDGINGLIDRIWKDIDPSHAYKTPRTDMMVKGKLDTLSYHNTEISRVLDYAGILPDEAERKMAERIQEIWDLHQLDIVILTAPDSDCKDEDAFCDDFFDYAGFGCGADFDGMILFVKVNPEDRYYTVTTCGTKGRSYFDEIIENQTVYDDMFDVFKAGNYEEGAWIFLKHTIRRINHMERQESFEGIERSAVKDASEAARVLNPNGILKDSVKDSLEKEIQNIRDKYDTDVLIIAISDTGDYYPEDYLDNYFTFYGYGEGSSKSGVGLILADEDGKPVQFAVRTFGKAKDRFPEKALKRLSSMVNSALGGTHYDSAARKFVEKVRFREKWGHYPMTAFATVIWFLVIFCVVSIVAAIKKGANRTISKAVTASEYLVPGTCKIHGIDERYINSKVTKTRRVESSSSGRSGGGGGGHISSSGRTHGGGGGRHF